MKIQETERLMIRQIQSSDAPFILALMNEPAYYENIGDRGVRTVQDAEKYITEKFTASYQKNGFGLYLVTLKDTTPIGMCGLIKRDSMKDVDIGYSLYSSFHGKGYAVEAARAILKHAQEDIGLKKVVALTKKNNTSSMKVLEKIGFLPAGTITLPEIGEEDHLFSKDL